MEFNKNKKIKKKLTKQNSQENLNTLSKSSSSSSITTTSVSVSPSSVLVMSSSPQLSKAQSPERLPSPTSNSLIDKVSPILRKLSFSFTSSPKDENDIISSPPIRSASLSLSSPPPVIAFVNTNTNNTSTSTSPSKAILITESTPIPPTISDTQMDKFTKFLTFMSKSEKPWYLYTSNMYKSSKNIVVYITSYVSNVDPIKYEKAVSTAEFAINKYIIPRIGTDEVRTLTSKLDNKITSLLDNTDNTIDVTRVKFADALLKVRTNLFAYTNSIVNSVKEKSNEVYDNVTTKKDQAVSNITNIVGKAKTFEIPSVPTVITFSKNKIAEMKAASVTATYATASVLLEKAQPYMKSAVDRAIPIVTKTQEFAQPYVAYAEPYVTPYVQKAKVAIEENSVTGPIVKAVVIKANESFLMAENYVMANLVDRELTVDAFGQD